MMPRLFLVNHSSQPFFYLRIGSSAAQKRTQIVFSHTKQTGANFPIRGKANPVTMAAERFAHGSNNTDFAIAFGKGPAFGSRRHVRVGDRVEREATLEPLEQFV